MIEYYEESHGNQIYRNVSLYENKAHLPKGWNGIQRIIKVRRWGYRKKKAFDETSYYILSKPINHASIVERAIRGHWSVENNLHWIKDVHLKEDNMTPKDKQQITALVYLNNAAISLITANGLKPNADTFAKMTNKISELIKLFQ